MVILATAFTHTAGKTNQDSNLESPILCLQKYHLRRAFPRTWVSLAVAMEVADLPCGRCWIIKAHAVGGRAMLRLDQ